MKKALNVFVYLIVLLLSVLLVYRGNQYINSHKVDGGMMMDREEELDTLIFAKISSLDGETEEETSGKKIACTAKTLVYGDDRSEVIKGYQILNSDSKNTSAVSVGDKVVPLCWTRSSTLMSM